MRCDFVERPLTTSRLLCGSFSAQPFHGVDADDAWDEGEGDRSLAYWRCAHREHFAAEATLGAFTFVEDVDVVFCRLLSLRGPLAKRTS